MKNSFQNCVDRLSKVEADLEEAREMLSYSLLERVRLAKELAWIAENSGACPPPRMASLDCLKDENKDMTCADCWRAAAKDALHVDSPGGVPAC